MSETRNRYDPTRAATPTKWDHAALGQEVVCRTVAELRRYLDGLPGEWRVEGPGNANALRVEAIPSVQAMPPLVYVLPIALDAAGRLR